MKFTKLIEKQKKIASKLKIRKLNKKIKIIGGVDISFKNDMARCAIVLLDFNNMEEIEKITYETKPKFPYISGFLAFREGPIILKAIKKLKNKPDILMFDGQGIAHPRCCGIASHIGVILNMPTIGVAKSRLYGSYIEPENKKFKYTYLYNAKDKIGVVLRTKKNSKPIFISPGNLVNLTDCLYIIKKCITKYKLPEPTHLAHNYAKL
ncbi:MAG: Endonuclease V [Methanobacterium sp. PtaU1.Bin242]|nr:MAG: Endonuclease V [Methanobacterium sp. PtaU1.Bin242]